MKIKIFKRKIMPTIKKNFKLVHKLNRQLKKINIDAQQLKYISVDLADIYGACEEYIGIIKRITSKKKIDKKSFANNMTMIEIILYHHLYWHMKELKNPFNKLLKILYGEKRQDIITKIFRFK